MINLSNFKFKKYLRGPDGIRTRTFCLRDRWSAINLQAQVTEAQSVYHRNQVWPFDWCSIVAPLRTIAR